MYTSFILLEMKILYHTHGEFMPKHIASGIKYLAACELRKDGLSQQEISQKLGIDRSTVSHYLNGRNISLDSIEVAKTILDFNPKDLLLMFNILFSNDLEIIRQLVLIFGLSHYETSVGDECIGCGLCVDLCIMNANTVLVTNAAYYHYRMVENSMTMKTESMDSILRVYNILLNECIKSKYSEELLSRNNVSLEEDENYGSFTL